MTAAPCRLCGGAVLHPVLDLGEQPLANALLRQDDLDHPEPRYPLRVHVCADCFLVQAEVVATPEELFSDYTYMSGMSAAWKRHVGELAVMAAARFGIGPGKRVVEVASNDGTALQPMRGLGAEVLGIEPAAGIAARAVEAGVPTEVAFFGLDEAWRIRDGSGPADLLVANNVLAHVPDLHDFAAGLAELLAPGGVLSLEFQHVAPLLAEGLFDTVYHEHHAYLSLGVVTRLLAEHGLAVFDAGLLAVHGGSLRVLARRAGEGDPATEPGVARIARDEERAGLRRLETYGGLQARVEATRDALTDYLDRAAVRGHTVVGYGAAAKGITLLNTCGVGRQRLPWVADLNPIKQGRLLPGSRIPVVDPVRLDRERPDVVLILPHNLRDEIAEQLRRVRGWGGRFVVALPRLEEI